METVAAGASGQGHYPKNPNLQVVMPLLPQVAFFVLVFALLYRAADRRYKERCEEFRRNTTPPGDDPPPPRP